MAEALKQNAAKLADDAKEFAKRTFTKENASKLAGNATVRRLHDTNRSEWWILIAFVPFVGGIWLLVLLALDSSLGSKRFGSNPKVA